MGMFAKMEDSLVSKIMFTTYCLIDLCKAIKNKCNDCKKL